jgi:gliding motility-associated-like protein
MYPRPYLNCLVYLFICLFVSELCYGQVDTSGNHPIHPLSALSVELTIVNPTCYTRMQPTSNSFLGDGAIFATASGGTAPYSYSLTFARPIQDNGKFDNLSPGNYEVVVTDALGEKIKKGAFLATTVPLPILGMDILKIPTSCVSSDGSLELKPFGGTPPYSFSVDGGVSFVPGQNVVNNLHQGYGYYFYLKDANGCLASANTTYGGSHSIMCMSCCNLVIDGIINKVSCTNEGQLTVSNHNTGDPIYYSLDGINYELANSTNQNVHIFSNLKPGVYHVYAKTSSGLIGQNSFTMPKACINNIELVTIDPGCNVANGSISVSPFFGSAPYGYSLDGINFQSSNVFGGMSAGNYRVHVRDASGEVGSGIALLNNNCPTIQLISTNENCGKKNGSIIATGANGKEPYQYSLDGINFQSSNSFTGLPAGQFIVFLKDAMGQTVSMPVSIQSNSCFAINAEITQPACGKANGTITIQAANGTKPYLYSIDGINFASAAFFGGLSAGSYSTMVKDATGNEINQSILLSDIPGPQLEVDIKQASCANNDGSLILKARGGVEPFLYSIDNGNNFQGTNIFERLSAGSYTALVKDANGCNASIPSQVTALPGPTVFLGVDTMICEGKKLLLKSRISNASYLWSNGSTSPDLLVTGAGTYKLKVVKDGCESSDEIRIDFLRQPAIRFVKDSLLCDGSQLELNAYFDQSSYKWQDGSVQPTFIVNKPGTYSVQVANQCGVTMASTLIRYNKCECKLFIANAFTPNMDGRNDILRPIIQCASMSHFSFKIYNRFGEEVFFTDKLQQGWDGTIKGNLQPSGTYIWTLEYNDLFTQKSVRQKGSIALIR